MSSAFAPTPACFVVDHIEVGSIYSGPGLLPSERLSLSQVGAGYITEPGLGWEDTMKVNEGAFDRATRVVVGIQMAALGLSGVVSGAEGLALIGLGTVLLVTGTSGRCLLYRWLGWSTLPKDRRAGPTDRRAVSLSSPVPIRSTDRRAQSRKGR